MTSNLVKIFAVLLLGPLLSGTARAGSEVSFGNFGELVHLTAQGERYLLEKKALQLQLSNRIIVKISASCDMAQLLVPGDPVEKITTLYQGKDFQYVMLELSGREELASVMNAFKKRPQILLVQPDILQLHSTGREIHAPSPASRQRVAPSSAGNPPILRKPPLLPVSPRARITIAIIDDGFDFSHPEFAHTNVVFQYDIETRMLDASPRDPQDSHGTRIAGVLFAEMNGNQVEGLVPDAGLIAIRQPDTWTSGTLLAFQVAGLAGADIINCSWNSRWLSEPICDVVRDLANNGRNGKGIAVVFAAGNEGETIIPYQREAGIPEAIVVGACDKDGKITGYSNNGPTVDIVLDGTAQPATANNGKFAIINGTSLAAAKVSGCIARLLQENPELTLSEVEQKLNSCP